MVLGAEEIDEASGLGIAIRRLGNCQMTKDKNNRASKFLRDVENILQRRNAVVRAYTTNRTVSKDLSERFKKAPSIDLYVKLRRENPDDEIEFATSPGIEWLFNAGTELEQWKIPEELVAGALDADEASICELSLVLLECLVKRREIENSGKVHAVGCGEAISDSFVNFLIAMMLDALSWNSNLILPRDLAILIRYQLIKDGDNAIGRKLEAKELRQSALYAGASLLERTGKVSVRKVAEMLKVSPSTITRQFPDNSFPQECSDRLKHYGRLEKSDTPFADMYQRFRGEEQPD